MTTELTKSVSPRAESRWARLWREETRGGTIFSPRLALGRFLIALLPDEAMNRARTAVYRHVWGIPIGSGTMILGQIAWGSAHLARHNVRIGARCVVNARVYIDAAAAVRIEDGASLGHDVLLITTDHAIGTPNFRAAERTQKPVTIGRGAWVAAGATVLPGRTVGAGAVVAAGAVVTHDVAPNVLAAGVPAREVRAL